MDKDLDVRVISTTLGRVVFEFRDSFDALIGERILPAVKEDRLYFTGGADTECGYKANKGRIAIVTHLFDDYVNGAYPLQYDSSCELYYINLADKEATEVRLYSSHRRETCSPRKHSKHYAAKRNVSEEAETLENTPEETLEGISARLNALMEDAIIEKDLELASACLTVRKALEKRADRKE